MPAKEIFQTLFSTGQRDAADDDHHHQSHEDGEHDLVEQFDAAAHFAVDDERSQNKEQSLKSDRLHRVGDERAEVCTESCLVGDDAIAEQCVNEVRDRPAAHSRVKAHHAVAGENAEVGPGNESLAAKRAVSGDDRPGAKASRGDFRDEQNKSHREGEDQVGKEECAAAIAAGKIGEFPNGPEADGCADA